MILIRKLAAPPGLQAKKDEWTERWVNGRPADWATPEAKRLMQVSLPALTHGKCCYCESILDCDKEKFIEVEHYHAKTVRLELAFEWTNLFPVCRVCNGSKRDQDHGGRLLKPDKDDGEDFFWLEGHTGELQPLTSHCAERALATIQICKLNRATLCRERQRLFQTTSRLLQTSRCWDDGMTSEFKVLLHPTTEHKLAVRSALPGGLADVDRRMYHAAD